MLCFVYFQRNSHILLNNRQSCTVHISIFILWWRFKLKIHNNITSPSISISSSKFMCIVVFYALDQLRSNTSTNWKSFIIHWIFIISAVFACAHRLVLTFSSAFFSAWVHSAAVLLLRSRIWFEVLWPFFFCGRRWKTLIGKCSPVCL